MAFGIDLNLEFLLPQLTPDITLCTLQQAKQCLSDQPQAEQIFVVDLFLHPTVHLPLNFLETLFKFILQGAVCLHKLPSSQHRLIHISNSSGDASNTIWHYVDGGCQCQFLYHYIFIFPCFFPISLTRELRKGGSQHGKVKCAWGRLPCNLRRRCMWRDWHIKCHILDGSGANEGSIILCGVYAVRLHVSYAFTLHCNTFTWGHQNYCFEHLFCQMWRYHACVRRIRASC